MRNRKPPVFRPGFAPSPEDAARARLKAWREREEREGKKRPSAAERGYDKDWFRLRARFLRANPWCLACWREGVQRKAEVVDHIQTIRDRPDLRLEPTNLQPLCRSHHNRKGVLAGEGIMGHRRKPRPPGG